MSVESPLFLWAIISTYDGSKYEKTTRIESLGCRQPFPRAHIAEHSLKVHPLGFAFLLAICAVSSPVSISIRPVLIRSQMELVGESNADAKCLATIVWHGYHKHLSFAIVHPRVSLDIKEH